MKEIMVIVAEDSDGSIVPKILSLLSKDNIQKLHIDSECKLSIKDLEIYPQSNKVYHKGIEIHLSHAEFSILCHLAHNPERIFTREQLYRAAWGDEAYCNYNTIHNTIYRLRRKLEPDPHNPIYIKTVIGVGYKFSKSSQ